MSTKALPQALPDIDPLFQVNPGGAWKKQIYQGNFTLLKHTWSYDVYGEVYYVIYQDCPWYIKFEGVDMNGSCNEGCSGRKNINLFSRAPGHFLFSKDVEVLSAPVDGNNVYGTLHGVIVGQVNNVTSYRWCYLNAPAIIGEKVDRKGKTSPDRLVFISKHVHHELYQIILENQGGYKTQKDHWEISHHCELRMGKNKSELKSEEVFQEIQLFSRFVSFFSGTHHAPWFLEGRKNNNSVSQFHECGYDRSMRNAVSWKPTNGDKDLIELWPLFRSHYLSSPQVANLMDTAINYYLDANDPTKPLVAAIASAISGLEVLSADLQRQWISVDDLLDIVDDNLRTHYNYDGRYHLMSSDITGRLSPLPYADPFSPDDLTCLAILVQYLELSILYWLGYEGKYYDRVEKRNKRVKIVRQ